MENLINRLSCFNIFGCTQYITEEKEENNIDNNYPTNVKMDSRPIFKDTNTFTVRGKKIKIENNFIE